MDNKQDKLITEVEKAEEALAIDRTIPLDEMIYISTTKSLAKQNKFKVGGVANVHQLIVIFADNKDEWYYSNLFKTSDFKACEKRIKDIIGRFKDEDTGLYNLNYSIIQRYVRYICTNYQDEVEMFNDDILFKSLKTSFFNVDLKPVVPERSISLDVEWT